MLASHASLRDDYAVSTPGARSALDLLARARRGRQPRLTGAGFGGSLSPSCSGTTPTTCSRRSPGRCDGGRDGPARVRGPPGRAGRRGQPTGRSCAASRVRAPGVRTPHQKRSRPSTTLHPRRSGTSARHLGPVALLERIGLPRRAAGRSGLARRRGPRRTSGSRVAAERVRAPEMGEDRGPVGVADRASSRAAAIRNLHREVLWRRRSGAATHAPDRRTARAHHARVRQPAADRRRPTSRPTAATSRCTPSSGQEPVCPRVGSPRR